MTRTLTAWLAVILLAAVVCPAGLLAATEVPASAPDVRSAATTQNEGGGAQPTPPEAAALLSLIQRVAPGQMNDRDPRAMMEYSRAVDQARTAMARLKKDFPEVAARPQVRAAELGILFDSSYLNSDLEMKDLRQAIATVLADDAAPRSLRAMAEYHQLNADAVVRANKQPASQPEAMPAWAGDEIDKRIAFGHKYKDQEIGRLVMGQAVIYKEQIDGYEKTKPLLADFIAQFPAEKPAQATLLATLADWEYSHNRDGWAKAKPIADRLLAEYRDQPVTRHELGYLATLRIRSDPKGGLEMVEQLTKEFPGDEAVARGWRDLALQAYSEKKSDLVAERLKVLGEKFPTSEARVHALATLAWLAYRQNGLDAVLPSLVELQDTFPQSPVVAQTSVAIAQAQVEKLGYEKAAGFVGLVLKKFAGTDDAKRLAEFVRRYQTQASQPDVPPTPGR